MLDTSKNYWVNNPIFLKVKDRFDLKRLTRIRELRKVFINERIVEIPFALSALSKLKGGARVLDLGCAESILPLYASYLDVAITGIDCRNYPYAAPNFKFLKCDILQLPFEEDSFDAVTCISTIEHIGIGFYGDTKRETSSDAMVIKEVQRILRQGGTLVLTVPYGLRHQNEQQRVYDYGAITELLNEFNILTQKYYLNTPLKNNTNMWRPVEKTEASKVDSSHKTECICCIIATL